MNRDLAKAQDGALVWMPERGVGYFEVVGEPYDAAYFDRYAAQGDTVMGRLLNAHRVALVEAWAGPEAYLLDVGVGAGTFLQHWNRGQGERRGSGFDVNPAGVAWLKERGWWENLYDGSLHPCATFWDALEHIREPSAALDCVGTWAFVAVPIFRDAAHVLASRHFRRDEHYWYWTRAGFVAFAAGCGFEVVDIVATETALGRDDVETFVLRRNRPAP